MNDDFSVAPRVHPSLDGTAGGAVFIDHSAANPVTNPSGDSTGFMAPSGMGSIPNMLPAFGEFGNNIGGVNIGATDMSFYPRTTFAVYVQNDPTGRVQYYQDGEFLFCINSKTSDEVIMAKTLSDINLTLRESHKKWQQEMKQYSGPDAAMRSKNENIKRKRSENIAEYLEMTNITSQESFLARISFIGVIINPGESHFMQDRKFMQQTNCRSFVICGDGGTISIANIFGENLKRGSRIGFVLKKFHNPNVFYNKDKMSWHELIDALEPLQLWPIVDNKNDFGRISRSAPIYSLALPGRQNSEEETDLRNSPIWRVPMSLRDKHLIDMNPFKTTQKYMDVIICRKKDANGIETFSWDTKEREGRVFHIGYVWDSKLSKPSLTEIIDAVSPRSNLFIDSSGKVDFENSGKRHFNSMDPGASYRLLRSDFEIDIIVQPDSNPFTIGLLY